MYHVLDRRPLSLPALRQLCGHLRRFLASGHSQVPDLASLMRIIAHYVGEVGAMPEEEGGETEGKGARPLVEHPCSRPLRVSTISTKG